MANLKFATGQQELKAARRQSNALYWCVGIFSFFVNLLMLTGPIYMLQVYDRVLGSKSIETLVALSILVAFLYCIMGLLDYARGRVMGRIAARFQAHLDKRVFDAVIRKSALSPDDNSASGLQNLEMVQRFISSPVLIAFFDLPWTPVFLFGIAIFHPWLAIMALTGGAFLIIIALINQAVTKASVANANFKSTSADTFATQLRTESEAVHAMGMREAVFKRWYIIRQQALESQIIAADLGGTFSNITKTFRLFLQSAMLGLGAYLVLKGEMTGGAMIAGSILLGRALAPVEQIVGQTALIQRAYKGWYSLADLLSEVPTEDKKLALPQPKARMDIQGLVAAAPSGRKAILKNITFQIEPGQAVGVIGGSGAGKSTLARVLTGVWKPVGGRVCLDGAPLDQYNSTALGKYIGYVPQRIQLFEGTIAENIARLSQNTDDDAIVDAAKKADAHDMILTLPDGYDTRVTPNGGNLSGGQIQRIGLARALYGNPVMLVLDEPNSNLDNEGSAAVNNAIKQFKATNRSVLIIAHRPAVIKECDTILMLQNGMVRSFGPRDDVLAEVLKNHSDITPLIAPKGTN